MPSILSIDEGTTGVTCLVIADDGRVLGRGYRELPQHFPRPGWVEHDPAEIWEAVRANEAALDGSGRVLVRASGTEPLVRIMGECEDAELLRTVVGAIEVARVRSPCPVVTTLASSTTSL